MAETCRVNILRVALFWLSTSAMGCLSAVVAGWLFEEVDSDSVVPWSSSALNSVGVGVVSDVEPEVLLFSSAALIARVIERVVIEWLLALSAGTVDDSLRFRFLESTFGALLELLEFCELLEFLELLELVGLFGVWERLLVFRVLSRLLLWLGLLFFFRPLLPDPLALRDRDFFGGMVEGELRW